MVATKQVREVSPLPVGRYWVTLSTPQLIAEFDAWIGDMGGAAAVEASELAANGASQFVIFKVPPGRAPFFDAPRFGFPNTAPPEVRFASDVEQAPEPEGLFGPGFSLPDLGPLFSNPVVWIVLLGLLASSGRSSSSGFSRRARA
jgi:hypothetical protein